MDDKTLQKEKAPHDYKDVRKADRRWTYQRWISKRAQKADSIVRDDIKRVRVSHINYYIQQEPFYLRHWNYWSLGYLTMLAQLQMSYVSKECAYY